MKSLVGYGVSFVNLVPDNSWNAIPGLLIYSCIGTKGFDSLISFKVKEGQSFFKLSMACLS